MKNNIIIILTLVVLILFIWNYLIPKFFPTYVDRKNDLSIELVRLKDSLRHLDKIIIKNKEYTDSLINVSNQLQDRWRKRLKDYRRKIKVKYEKQVKIINNFADTLAVRVLSDSIDAYYRREQAILNGSGK